MSDGDSTKMCKNTTRVGAISHTKVSANWVRGYRAEGPSTLLSIDGTLHSTSATFLDRLGHGKELQASQQYKKPICQSGCEDSDANGRTDHAKLDLDEIDAIFLFEKTKYRLLETLSNMAVVSRVCSALFYASSKHAISCKTLGRKMISTSLPTFWCITSK